MKSVDIIGLYNIITTLLNYVFHVTLYCSIENKFYFFKFPDNIIKEKRDRLIITKQKRIFLKRRQSKAGQVFTSSTAALTPLSLCENSHEAVSYQ